MNATPQAPQSTPSSYAEAGVDEEREQVAFAWVMRPWLARTKVRSKMVTSITGLAKCPLPVSTGAAPRAT
jgi:hypothetical protein